MIMFSLQISAAQMKHFITMSWREMICIYSFLFYVKRSCGDCGANFSSFIGTFTSPRYPAFYKNNLDCTWNIKVPDGYMIKLIVWDIHFEGPYMTCTADYLSIKESEEVLTRCDRGIEEPLVFYSSSSELSLSFHSDSSSRGRGFNASYNAITKLYQCDFESLVTCDLTFAWSNNDFNWTDMRGSDDYHYSGPTEDDTFGNSSGSYLVAKAKRGGGAKVPRSAEVILPSYVPAIPSSSIALQFSYHMWFVGFGNAIGEFSIAACGRIVFSRSGNQKDVWHTEEVDIGNAMDNCTVTVTVNTVNIDIAIDDIAIYEVIKQDIPEDVETYVTEVLQTERTDYFFNERGNDSKDINEGKGGLPGDSLVFLTPEDIAFIAVTSVAIMLVFLISVLVYVLIRVKRSERRPKRPISESSTFTNGAYSSLLDDHLRDDVISDVSSEPPVRWEQINELMNGKVDEMLIVYNVAYQSVDKYHDNGIKKDHRNKRRKKKGKAVNFQTIKEEAELETIDRNNKR